MNPAIPAHKRHEQLDARERELADRERAFEESLAKRSKDIEQRESKLAIAEYTLENEARKIEEREKNVALAEQHIVAELAAIEAMNHFTVPINTATGQIPSSTFVVTDTPVSLQPLPTVPPNL